MGVPKPLVQVNQIFIIIFITLGLIVSQWFLLILFLIGIITLINKRNPVIQFSKRFLKKPTDNYPMEEKAQLLFNQWIATICIGLSLFFFEFGYTIVAYIFAIMVVLAAGLALIGYCIGCSIRYRYLMWKHARESE